MRNTAQPFYLAIFSYNDHRSIPDKYTLDFPTLPVLEFRYLQLHLIKKDWREFINNDNPAAAAMLSKLGYTEKERVQVRLEFLGMVSRMQLDPAKTELLYGFFDTYLKLDDKEEQQLREKAAELPKEEADRVLELPNYYFDRGMEKGVEKGRQEEIKKIIFSMIKNGFSDESISNVTGWSVAKLQVLRKNDD